MQWVEQDVAPEQIIASKIVNGVTTFTRPLCPYPALPRYSGVGDTTKASISSAPPTVTRRQPTAGAEVSRRRRYYPIVLSTTTATTTVATAHKR